MKCFCKTKFNLFQLQKSFNINIQKYGCYLLCLHFYASHFNSKEYCVHDVNENYNELVKLNAIGTNCYIMRPDLCLKYLANVNTSVSIQNHNYVCKEDKEFQISNVRIEGVVGKHFMVTMGSDDILYDSLRLTERGKKFKFIDKRIFKIINV